MTNQAAKTSVDEYPVGVFTSVFSGGEAFLADHLVKGKKILPGMAYLEMTRAAVASMVEINAEEVIELRDSIFLLPIVVEKRCSIEVKIYPGGSGEYGVEVCTEQGVHYQSKAYVHASQKIDKDSHNLDLQRLTEQCVIEGPSKEDIYANFDKLGLKYGSSHRGIESIKLGENCALASIFVNGSSQKAMAMNPGMLDSVIQCGATLASHSTGIAVPFAVKSTKIIAPLTDRVYAYVVRNEDSMDYTVTDETGKVLVAITGFVSRELDFSSQQDQVVYYKPIWTKEPLADLIDVSGKTTISEQSSYRGLVEAVFNAARSLIESKAEEHLIDVELPEGKPGWRGVIGLLKTISQEYPKIKHRLRTASNLLNLDYEPTNLAAGLQAKWPDRKTILITGGMGGLGKLIATDIAQNSDECSLILVGRSKLDTPMQDYLGYLESLGCIATYESCDIASRSAVDDLLTRWPNISGVIHASGLVQDNLIVNKSSEEIDRVFAPKVDGLVCLDEATSNFELEYFTTFSSIAGPLGNVGQSDYAAANAFMDDYMTTRARRVRENQRFGKSISINWPLWESDGMQVDEATKKNILLALKIKPLPASIGLQSLRQIIESAETQVLVMFGHKKSIDSLFSKKIVSQKSTEQKSTNVKSNKLVREILNEIRIQAANHLKLRPDQLDDDADWSEFGFDSILLSSFVNKFNTEFDLDLMPTALFEATNIQLFSEYLADHYPQEMARKLSVSTETRIKEPQATPDTPEVDQEKVTSFAKGLRKAYKSSVAYREEDVAIVGMSCRIAGAKNTQEFWQLLEDEKDMITEIPSDRWDWRTHTDSAKWGSFIDGVAEFDPLFFGISPAEAMYMAPEQRLMMQSVWECLENAGCSGDSTKGSNTGIFIGCGQSGYSSLLREMPIEAYSSTGLVTSVGPNRISYLMDWHGPSEPIETACSSALVAIHRAVQAIRSGHCDQAIAGGVNLLLNPESYISFTKAGMLSEDGRCKTFSDQANGYVRGEGIGILMLKPLKAALRDGNIIHALIKGTAENHGGRTNSLTAPNPKSQAAVIGNAVSDAGIDFSRLSYIECHGTGTELGDPVEIEGLKSISSKLLDDKPSAPFCKLGSIKSNIGHLEMAAGVVGLIKVVLQMKHRKIARSLHCDSTNPYIDLAGTPFQIAQNASEWEVPAGQTRVAGVSSFGFGGVNAHVILEEFQEPDLAPGYAANETSLSAPQLLVISARTKESLLQYVAKYPSYFKTLPSEPGTLERMAYTLQLGRAEMQERLVFIANSVDDWAEQVDLFLEKNGNVSDRRIFRGTVKSGASNNLEIGDTQAGEDYIRNLMEADEYGKLAELWVKGTKINWQSLWPH